MFVQRKTSDASRRRVAFGTQWLIASVLGFGIVAPFAFVLGMLNTIGQLGFFGYSSSTALERAQIWSLPAAAIAIAIAIAQWLVMWRWHVPRAYALALIAAVGWTATVTASLALLPSTQGFSEYFIAVTFGAVTLGAIGFAVAKQLPAP